ncbi:MAG: hypothetical protein WD060_09380 [Pirellulales bacterium]
MDAHFNEYLAAVVGMQDLYGHPVEDHPSEFHGAGEPEAAGHCSPDFCSALGGTS